MKPKPLDRSDAAFLKKYARLDDYLGMDEQFKRDEKRVWKKARTRHLRAVAKKDLRRREGELE